MSYWISPVVYPSLNLLSSNGLSSCCVLKSHKPAHSLFSVPSTLS